jgi:membrane-associated phospholipid phosphatase
MIPAFSDLLFVTLPLYHGKILHLMSGWLSYLHTHVYVIIAGVFFAAAALTLYAFDLPITAWIQQRRNRYTDTLSRFVKPFGDGRNTLPALGALALYGDFAPSLHAEKTALLCLVSFLITGIIAQSLQLLTHRYRPVGNALPRAWEGPKLRSSNRSFPSGHASASFSVLTVIAYQYHYVHIVPIIALVLALLTSFSRLNDRAHRPSDVYLGSILGFIVASLTVALLSC